MGFETKVLNAVRDQVPQAYFYNGSLICEHVDQATVDNVLYDLRAIVTCDVNVTVVHDETVRFNFNLFQ